MARLVTAGISLCAVLLAAVTLAPAWSSQASGPQEPAVAQQPIRIQVNLVNLFATVRDKKTKRILNDLQQNEFKIEEEGDEQTISDFSRETNLPITLGILMDTSGSVRDVLAAEQEAAIRFLDRVMRKGDLTMFITFDSEADLLANFTEDKNILANAIRRARIRAPMMQGTIGGNVAGTVFYDAVYLACTDKLALEAGRKALVILTDAQDSGSRMRAQDAIEAAQRTDTVVHVLLIAPGWGANEGAAKKLTEETGGRTIVVRNEENLEEAFDLISEELRSQYVLSYTSTNTARDGAFRRIKVESTRKDVEILTRRGYYAPKE
jgi:VWFA-related protein